MIPVYQLAKGMRLRVMTLEKMADVSTLYGSVYADARQPRDFGDGTNYLYFPDRHRCAGEEGVLMDFEVPNDDEFPEEALLTIKFAAGGFPELPISNYMCEILASTKYPSHYGRVKIHAA